MVKTQAYRLIFSQKEHNQGWNSDATLTKVTPSRKITWLESLKYSSRTL